MEITGDLCGVFDKIDVQQWTNLTCITVTSQCNQNKNIKHTGKVR